MKRDEFERQDGSLALSHLLNVLFKPARGVDRAELAVRVYDDIYAGGVSHGDATNAADIGSVGCVGDSAITVIACGNNVLGVSHVGAGIDADADVSGTVVKKSAFFARRGERPYTGT